ncbi:MAG TPA: hypothetical protein VMI33_26350 [Streptosporangiaceae bacterium]|nr:hypothetical protein [Streptosporangiaceae bacterium]
MRILLSDGSGLTSRQVAGQLSAAGHHVEVLSPERLCLCRFTRHVRRVNRVPGYGGDPLGWLDAALAVYRAGGFDVLFPTQEQVAVLALVSPRLEAEGVRTAVPAFEAVRAVQDKVSAWGTLGALGIPQPPTVFFGSADDLLAWRSFPVFIKVPIGTATSGVRRVGSATALRSAAAELETAGVFPGGGVVAQEPADGPLAMIQTVFAGGEMVAAHANLRVREGARGGASHKRSLDQPAAAIAPVEKLGRALRWHGALSADAILTGAGPVLIDVNPRLVEPVNAWRAGVDLTGALLEVARGRRPAAQPPGRPGVATHQLLLAVLGAGADGRGRRGVAAEVLAALARTGSYRGSAEELTPAGRDPLAAVPVLAAAAGMLIRPALWHWLAGGGVAGYALTPAGWDRLLEYDAA